MDAALDEPVLIIKAAWGGKSLHTDFRPPNAGPFELPARTRALWDQHPQGAHAIPKLEERDAWWQGVRARTGVYYRLMIDHVKRVLADPKRVCPAYDPKEGYEIAGFAWLQGWNDMVDGSTYPDRDKPGGYKAYSETMAHFIRDVRRDLNVPKLPFVIGVLGVPTYGNTLMGLAASAPLRPEDNFSVTYFAPQPRAVLRIVDPNRTDHLVDYGAWGRVELTTLTRVLFLPRFLERDEAIRRPPRAPYAGDGVGDVRPFGAL